MELLPGMRSDGQILCQENIIVCAIKGLCADADICPDFIGGFVDDGYNRAAVCLPDNQFFRIKSAFLEVERNLSGEIVIDNGPTGFRPAVVVHPDQIAGTVGFLADRLCHFGI